MGNERRRGTSSERYFQSRRVNQKKNDSSNLRKVFIASGAIGASVLIAGGACLATRNDEDTTSGREFSDVSTYFPELEGKNVQENGSFTGGGRNIDYYNFTKNRFNPLKASQIYDFVNSIQQSDFLINLESNSGEKLNLKLERPLNKDINIFIVSQDDGVPSYLSGVADPYGRGGTAQNETMTPSTTIIRMYDKGFIGSLPTNSNIGFTPQEIANTTMYTEACQALFRVTVDGTPDIRFQETLCNSLDLMHGSKRQGKNYEDYYKEVLRSTMQLGDITLPMVPFSQELFDRMPVVTVFE